MGRGIKTGSPSLILNWNREGKSFKEQRAIKAGAVPSILLLKRKEGKNPRKEHACESNQAQRHTRLLFISF
jgi:hypothetical protein